MRTILTLLCLLSGVAEGRGLVVLQSDFGLKDQAVAAMRGVARRVDPDLVVDDLTHEIPAYNIWEASFRLDATVDYWPTETVFVSVVDPGVGTGRRSVAVALANGQHVVTPDNGTLTLVADRIGVRAVREIDEDRHRLPGSEGSHTFHGRDVYAYVGALLASGRVAFAEVGPELTGIERLEYARARRVGAALHGGIPVLDPQYGNVWSNIDAGWLAIDVGSEARVIIRRGDDVLFDQPVPYARTFGEVPMGAPLLYANSVGRLAVALNQGDFAAAHGIAAGREWGIEITPVEVSDE